MRIAIAGSGISGLAAAWLLAPSHEVHLFEARSRLGGHTHTLAVDERTRSARTSAANLGAVTGHTDLDDEGLLHVDTGFIVYNEPTYPLLTALFDELGVATQPSDMSWSLRCLPQRRHPAHHVECVAAQLVRLPWRGSAGPR